MTLIKEKKHRNYYFEFVSFSFILVAMLGQLFIKEFPRWSFHSSLLIGIIGFFIIRRNYRNEIVKISIKNNQIFFFKRKKMQKPYLKKRANQIGFFLDGETIKIGFVTFNRLSYFSAIKIIKKEWGNNFPIILSALKEMKVIESSGGNIKNEPLVKGLLDSTDLSNTESIDLDLDLF